MHGGPHTDHTGTDQIFKYNIASDDDDKQNWAGD